MAAVEEEIARLEAARAAIRSAIGEIVTTLPDQAATVGEDHIRVLAPCLPACCRQAAGRRPPSSRLTHDGWRG